MRWPSLPRCGSAHWSRRLLFALTWLKFRGAGESSTMSAPVTMTTNELPSPVGWQSLVETLCSTFWNGREESFSTIASTPCSCVPSKVSMELAR